MERIVSGADRAAGRWGAAHTRCTKPGRTAGEYVATAVNADAGSCKHVSATINADAVFELDAAADGFSEPAQLCDQRT